MIGSQINKRYGRRTTVCAMSCWAIVCAIINVTATSRWQIFAGRILNYIYVVSISHSFSTPQLTRVDRAWSSLQSLFTKRSWSQLPYEDWPSHHTSCLSGLEARSCLWFFAGPQTSKDQPPIVSLTVSCSSLRPSSPHSYGCCLSHLDFC